MPEQRVPFEVSQACHIGTRLTFVIANLQKAATRDPLLSSARRRSAHGATQTPPPPQPGQPVPAAAGRQLEAVLVLAAPSTADLDPKASAGWEGGDMGAWLEAREAAAAEAAMPMPMPASPQGGAAASSPGQRKASEVQQHFQCRCLSACSLPSILRMLASSLTRSPGSCCVFQDLLLKQQAS